jgi:hypothetical protein
MKPSVAREREVLQATQSWLERAVIGLNLCPFAKAVHAKCQIHYALCWHHDSADVLGALSAAMHDLRAQTPEQRDTTLLIVQNLLQDFHDYNDFLNVADDCLRDLNLEGEIQIASFHPHYQFAGTTEDDITNFTNRSPYPTLHLIREASIDRAVAAFPEAEAIFEVNMATMTQLGLGGWQALEVGASLPQNETDEKKSS